MKHSRDPLNTLGDRVRSSWKPLLIVALCLVLAAIWGRVTVTGKETSILGHVVRVEKIARAKILHTDAIVLLDNGKQVRIDLPSTTNCDTGSKINLLRRETAAGDIFRADTPACVN